MTQRPEIAPESPDYGHSLSYDAWSFRFALEEGLFDDRIEEQATFRCPVCGAVIDWPGRCSAECEYAWKGYDDPREYEVGYGG